MHAQAWAIQQGPGTTPTQPAWLTFRVDGVVTHLHRGRPVRRCTRHGIA